MEVLLACFPRDSKRLTEAENNQFEIFHFIILNIFINVELSYYIVDHKRPVVKYRWYRRLTEPVLAEPVN